jgi:hypothetical protein
MSDRAPFTGRFDGEARHEAYSNLLENARHADAPHAGRKRMSAPDAISRGPGGLQVNVES